MILLYLLVTAGYLASAWLEWRIVTSRLNASSQLFASFRFALVPVAISAHAALVMRAIFSGEGLDLSLANVLSAVSGLVALFAWLSGLIRTLPGTALVTLPIAAIGALLPALFPNPHRL